MKTINQIADAYLKSNGIMAKFFADYIGCNKSVCSKWLNGQISALDTEQMKKVHEFLDGKHLKTVNDILKE